MKRNEARGIVYLLLTAIIWGGSFISQLFGGEILGPFHLRHIDVYLDVLQYL